MYVTHGETSLHMMGHLKSGQVDRKARKRKKANYILWRDSEIGSLVPRLFSGEGPGYKAMKLAALRQRYRV